MRHLNSINTKSTDNNINKSIVSFIDYVIYLQHDVLHFVQQDKKIKKIQVSLLMIISHSQFNLIFKREFTEIVVVQRPKVGKLVCN